MASRSQAVGWWHPHSATQGILWGPHLSLTTSHALERCTQGVLPPALGQMLITSGAGQWDDSEFGPAKCSHRQEPGLSWSSCYCNLRAKEETHQAPQQSPHPVTQHFSASLTLPVQTTGSTCSAVRTRTYKEPKPNKIYPSWHESSLSSEKPNALTNTPHLSP